MSQFTLPFNLFVEKAERDRALDLFEENRRELLSAARKCANELYSLNGRVTAPEVFASLRAGGWGDALDQVDPRFMGGVFREGTGWRRVGWENEGSHRRPVSIWVRRIRQETA